MAYNWPLQSADLATFLGMTQIDDDRASLMLELASDLCSTIVNPVPSNAASVVLAVAARAFTNAQQLTESHLGTAGKTFGATSAGSPIGGLYLSRSDKANLRRFGGGTSAFNTSMLPVGANCVQTLTVQATAGTFVLSFGGASTAPIAFDASSAAIAAALLTLPAIGGGNVTVGAANPFAITFVNGLATTAVPPILVDATGLTGVASVVVTTPGVARPGQDLPAWDRDYYNGSRILGSQVYGGPW